MAGTLTINTGTAPSTPAAGYLVLYSKSSDKRLYYKDETGTEQGPLTMSIGINSGTLQASTSGTSIDFTGLPSTVKRITIMLNGVSTSGASNLILQIGAGSPDTSGYSSVLNGSVTGTTTITTATSGYLLSASVSSATTNAGTILLTTLGSNIWTSISNLGRNDGVSLSQAGGKTLSGTLDRVRITTAGGTDTFDAGSINILYE